jgi:hypothetical protein
VLGRPQARRPGQMRARPWRRGPSKRGACCGRESAPSTGVAAAGAGTNRWLAGSSAHRARWTVAKRT